MNRSKLINWVFFGSDCVECHVTIDEMALDKTRFRNWIMSY